MTLTTSRILRDFVTPEICENLLHLGICTNSPYKWYHQPEHNTFLLYTYAFDQDNIYRATDFAFWNSQNEKPRSFDALCTADLDSILPPYMLVKNGTGNYTLCPDNFYHEIEEIHGTRIPDLLAAFLVQLLKHKILKACDINLSFSDNIQ